MEGKFDPRPYVEAGQRVKALREEKGWSQDTLSVEAGLSPCTVMYIEQGGAGHRPRLDTYEIIARALGVHVGKIVDMSSYKKPVCRLHRIRRKRGLTQKELAMRAGVSETVIANWSATYRPRGPGLRKK